MMKEDKKVVELITNQMKDILYRIAYYKYTNCYSSSCYTSVLNDLECALSPLISLAEKLGLDLSSIKSSYCGWEYNADEFLNYEDLTKRY